MKRTLLLLLLAALSAGAFPAAAAAPGPAAAPKKKNTSGAPVFNLALPDLPKLDGVKAPPTAPAEGPAAAAQAGPPVLEKVELARDFDANHGGRKPRGALIKEFRLATLPATTEPFKSLVRIKSPGGKALRLTLHLVAPDGVIQADTSTDVSYPYGQDTIELVVKWDGIEAKAAGTYRIEVLTGTTSLGSAPVEIVWGG